MDTVSITRGELLELGAAIRAALGAAITQRFGYALGRTRRSILGELEGVDEALAANRRRRRDVAERYARQVDGKPATTDGGAFDIDPAKRREYVDELDVIQADERKFLAERVDVEVHRVPWSEAPEKLLGGAFDGLWPMLTGEPGGGK